MTARLGPCSTLRLCITSALPFTRQLDDRSPESHSRIPHLQKATWLLGRRAGAVSPGVRGNGSGEGYYLHDRRGRIRRLSRAKWGPKDHNAENVVRSHISN